LPDYNDNNKKIKIGDITTDDTKLNIMPQKIPDMYGLNDKTSEVDKILNAKEIPKELKIDDNIDNAIDEIKNIPIKIDNVPDVLLNIQEIPQEIKIDDNNLDLNVDSEHNIKKISINI
jgi:hypothetical protein